MSNSKILGRFETNSLHYDIGSDNHWPYGKGTPFETQVDAANNLGKCITEARGNELLFLLGDQFYAHEFFHSSEVAKSADLVAPIEAVNTLLFKVSQAYSRVFYVPGNHDLRRGSVTENPWADIKLPNNVIMPVGAEPILYEECGVRILLANIFYDLKFLDPVMFGTTENDLMNFYENNNYDGKYLLKGPDSISDFREMTKRLASSITPDVDIVATHALPHPSLVQFKLEKPLDKTTEEWLKSQNIHIDYNNPEDETRALKYGLSTSNWRMNWNSKSFFMGSNVFEESLGARPRDGVTFLYGHNHRGGETHLDIGGVNVTFRTHQRLYETLNPS